MKVILLQDVAKLGKRAEVVEVPNGYATNQLIPKKMAEAATKQNLERITKLQAESAAQEEKEQTLFAETAAALAKSVVTVTADANDQDHLFKAVSEQDIAVAAATVGVTVNPAMIVIAKPIKEVGKHEVILARGNQKHTFTVDVVKAS